jgi:hypothetical protein
VIKHSLIACALFFCGVINAQTGFVEFPYNPDSDGDDFIGITDLLSLLSLYESEFSEEGLFLASDSTEALYYTGNKTYYRCHKSCSDLPGDWRIPTHDQLLDFELSQMANGNAWIQYQIDGVAGWNIQGYSNAHSALVIEVGRSSDNANGQWGIEGRSNSTVGCYCYTRERPRVEYVICSSSSVTDTAFVNCLSEKTQDGWWPLGSIEIAPNNAAIQSFWRWKE